MTAVNVAQGEEGERGKEGEGERVWGIGPEGFSGSEGGCVVSFRWEASLGRCFKEGGARRGRGRGGMRDGMVGMREVRGGPTDEGWELRGGERSRTSVYDWHFSSRSKLEMKKIKRGNNLNAE